MIVVPVGKRALARHLAHPDIGLPWSIEDFALLRVSAARALVRNIRLLHRTSQHFTAFWQHGWLSCSMLIRTPSSGTMLQEKRSS